MKVRQTREKVKAIIDGKEVMILDWFINKQKRISDCNGEVAAMIANSFKPKMFGYSKDQ